MSKRCCAKMCFNSQVRNKNVTYFGFPKYEEYVIKWAVAAGRADLLEKKLSSIIKYFLCSEHFTDDCFADPPHNTRLKKSNRPVRFPIPTIFNCNIDKYIPNITINRNPIVTNDPPDEPSIQESVLTDDMSLLPDGYEYHEVSNSASLLNNIAEGISDIDNIDVNIDELANDNSLDHIDPYNINMIIPVDNEQISELICEDSNRQNDNLVFVCRLCATMFLTEEELSDIAVHSGLIHKLNVLLPDMIRCDDNLPQWVCKSCLHKVNACINTLDFFKEVQFNLRRTYGLD